MRTVVIAAALLAASSVVMAIPANAQVSIGISVRFAPPALPVYVQPAIPGPDYIWLPGYWAWDEIAQAYFWVPGTWALAPQPGFLWTPAWWGWDGGIYRFHTGYWAPHVGFYGGIAYGFGYTGLGYAGAYWSGGHVFYNRTVNNITNVNVTNVYNQTIVNRRTSISYNGGPGGATAQPTPAEQAAMRGPRIPPTPDQIRHLQMARANPQAFANVNHGHPPIAATLRPRQFDAATVVPARGAAPSAVPRATGPGTMPYHGPAGEPPRGLDRGEAFGGGPPTPARGVTDGRHMEEGPVNANGFVSARAPAPHAPKAPPANRPPSFREGGQSHPAPRPHPAARPPAKPQPHPRKEERRQ